MGLVYIFIAFLVGAGVGCFGMNLYNKGREVGNLICDLDSEYIFKLELLTSINNVYKRDKISLKVVRK